MGISLEIICILVQIILVVYSVKVWKWRCFVAPGFYYGILWCFATIGYLSFQFAGLFEVVSEKNIIELCGFVTFTGLCFLFFTWQSRNKINNNQEVNINFLNTPLVFIIISVIILIIAIYTFIKGGHGLDLLAARDAVHETLNNQSVIVGYAQAMNVPLCILAGSYLSRIIQRKLKFDKIQTIALFLPLFANLFFSLYQGGRVDFIYGLIYYAVGFSLAIKINIGRKLSKRLLVYVSVVAIIGILFISFVAEDRRESELSELKYEYIKSQGQGLEYIYAPLEYATESYMGYQYRRDDAVDLSKPGYGIYTFNGFINWTVPFASRLGLNDLSIADTFDVRYDNQETYDYYRPFYYVVHSCYIPMVKDFGPVGTYLAIIFLTWIANLFFIKIQRKKNINWATSIFFFIIFFNYWIKSNFMGTLSSSVMVFLYGFLIVDLIKYITRSIEWKR